VGRVYKKAGGGGFDVDDDESYPTEEVVRESIVACGLTRGARNPKAAITNSKRAHGSNFMGDPLLAWDLLLETAREMQQSAQERPISLEREIAC
jgi:hypothetical protein